MSEVTRIPPRNRLPEIRTLSRSEGYALFDRRARAELGISGKTFIKQWNAGRYAKRAERPGVVRVAMLLPFAHRLPGARPFKRVVQRRST